MPKEKKNNTNSKKITKIAISWILYSIKILLGDEGIRRYIILHYFPNLTYSEPKILRTFNAFIQKGKTRKDKLIEIEKYLKSIEKLKKDIVVFTASNVQRNEYDIETHYQSYIVDNNNKNIYIIDPAFDKTKDNYMGIYYAEITHELIKPFFENKGYNINFVRLSNPAQTSNTDVFCQSWSLLILLQVLQNSSYEANIEYIMPKKEIDRFDIILNFYKKIFTDMPALQENLKVEYTGTINDSSSFEESLKFELLSYNPVDILMNMKKEDMQE